MHHNYGRLLLREEEKVCVFLGIRLFCWSSLSFKRQQQRTSIFGCGFQWDRVQSMHLWGSTGLIKIKFGSLFWSHLTFMSENESPELDQKVVWICILIIIDSQFSHAPMHVYTDVDLLMITINPTSHVLNGRTPTNWHAPQ